MIPVLEERGGESYRIIAMDWIGMGKSDKPVDLKEHTYKKQVNRLKEFIQQVIPKALEEPTITLFVQDWGSLIGLRVAGDEPQWFRRIISANGMLPLMPPEESTTAGGASGAGAGAVAGGNTITIHNPINYNCSDTRSMQEVVMDRIASSPCGPDTTCFGLWANYALTSPALSASDVLQLLVPTLDDTTKLAYDAPFSNYIYKAAIRAFPSMLAGVHEPEFGNHRAWESLQNFTRPYLSLAGEKDRTLGSPRVQQLLTSNIPGAKVHDFEHRRYADAGHFIQEDVGEEMAAYVADFIEGTPLVGFEDHDVVEDIILDDASSSSAALPQRMLPAHYHQHGGGTAVVFLLVFSVLRKMVMSAGG